MEPYDLLATLARDGEAFAEVAGAAASAGPSGLAQPVPSCPGWTLADLVWHLAEVHHFWRTIVGEQRDTWEGYQQPTRPADDELVQFYREGLEHTVTVLAAAHPQQANWTWSHQRDAGFVMRRMAHETAVHLWDALQATGASIPTEDGAGTSIDGEFAADGVDEFLHHFLTADAIAAAGGSVHVHCTDVAGEWTVRQDVDGEPVVTREHSKGDAAMRGSAAALLLALWRRIPLDTIDIVGDADVARRVVAAAMLD